MDLFDVLLIWAIFFAFLSFVPLFEYTILYLADRRSTKQQLVQKDSHQTDGSGVDQ